MENACMQYAKIIDGRNESWYFKKSVDCFSNCCFEKRAASSMLMYCEADFMINAMILNTMGC